MTSIKPIIKLPSRSKSCSTSQFNYIGNRDGAFIASKKIYFQDNQHGKVSDFEIQTLLNDYNICQIQRERGGCCLSFPDSKIADRVYSLFNGYTFQDGTVLKFKVISLQNDIQDPQPEGPILQVENLPQRYADHNALYDLFRPFGSLCHCKSSITTESEGTVVVKALVQFFFKEDSDLAVLEMNNKKLEGNAIFLSAPMVPTAYLSVNINQSASTPINNNGQSNQDNSPSFVDYKNLYVRNLDSAVDSLELHRLFCEFGSVVSARVMSNSHDGQSKGYGFVSFSKPEDAALAREEMNGYMCNSKPMVVDYHSSKKPRKEKSSSTTTSSFHSPPTPTIDYNMSHSPYVENRHPHEVGSMNGLYIGNVDPLTMNGKDLSNLPVGTAPGSLRYKHSNDSVTTVVGPGTSHHSPPRTLASLASGAKIQQAPSPPYQENNNHGEYFSRNHYASSPEKPEFPSLSRKGSCESVCSVMTESSTRLQRQRMTAAVEKCGSYGKALPDIVSMLLTLNRKMRSTCLFNPEFLKERISSAIDALEICEDDEDEEQEEIVIVRPTLPINNKREARQFPLSPPISSTQIDGDYLLHSKNIRIPKAGSKAIQIVAPPSDAKLREIKAIFEDLEGKPTLHEKKQFLGDKLFPLVKATGFKQAPKITIRLLDTVGLEELVKIMVNERLIKAKVEEVFSSLQT